MWLINMYILPAVKIALRGLRVNKMRSGLTMLGIIIGVAAVITMLAGGEGAQASLAKSIFRAEAALSNRPRWM